MHDLAFVVPNYDWWEAPFYGLGLKLYQLLAGKYGFGTSRILSEEETLGYLPTLKTEGLRGGAVYYDGQFDDARLLIHMVATAFEQGATLLNYVEVTGLTKDAQGFVDGVSARDVETGNEFRAAAKVVVNATGAFCDLLRLRAEPSATPMIVPSQGIHLVFDSSFLQGESAVMVPHTSDGRVLFAIPWHGHTLVGTTDTPIAAATLEPVAMEQEIEFILATAGQYLTKAPTRDDVLSVFAGIRPLVSATGVASGVVRTAALSRDHLINIDRSGLVTVCGGKWTTYRHIAEDCVDQAATLAQLPERPCVTHHLHIHGFTDVAKIDATKEDAAKQFGSLAVYGSDAHEIRKLIATDARLSEPLHASLPYVKAEVIWGSATRNGSHRGRRARQAHPRAVLECTRSARHGTRRRGLDGVRTGVGRGYPDETVGCVSRRGFELRASSLKFAPQQPVAKLWRQEPAPKGAFITSHLRHA